MSARSISRRTMLRASGVALGLPFLEAMTPAFARSAAPKRRMVAINLGLGLHLPHLVPAAAGRNYELTPYLNEIKAYRDHVTVISGTSHPGVDGGHLAEKSFLTTVPHPGSASFRNSISLDQLAAEKIGLETRFGFLTLSTAGRGLSWTRSGVEIPTDSRASQLYAKLFLEGKADEKARRLKQLKDGRSVLDAVSGQTGGLQRELGAADREKLEDYLGAVREAEKRLLKAEAWEGRPKPKTETPQPKDPADRLDIVEHQRLLYGLMHLALATDSTRIITFFKNGMNAVPKIPGVTQDYHNLSHHGKDSAKIEELGTIERAQIGCYGEFLGKLQASKEEGSTLLDLTMVLIGSNLGNASSHDNRNLPIVLAGGGFKHGSHLALGGERDYPLSNLFVSMLQRLGIETSTFGTGTTTMKGLEFA
ncbi:MAG: DUF1552 domain-containing protein [Planctomycetota bacterium]|nr:MAG: DUF1552 domain-containing protein [Planctomycetota bacterium]